MDIASDPLSFSQSFMFLSNFSILLCQFLPRLWQSVSYPLSAFLLVPDERHAVLRDAGFGPF
jgi:hypothetical protein